MIIIENIHKSYMDNKVLRGIDLKIHDGEVVSIIGPSGGGKSTFLKTINCLEVADEGSIEIDGFKVDMRKKTNKEMLYLRQQTSMVFQNFNLFRNKTVLENVTEGLRVVKKVKKDAADKIAIELLKKVGLEDKLNAYPNNLSGGQQQRVAIARALSSNPKIILFDEPTSALDPELVGDVLKIIRDLAKEKMTMLIVTHQIKFAKQISDKICFMDEGRLIESNTPTELLENTKSERIKSFLQSIPE